MAKKCLVACIVFLSPLVAMSQINLFTDSLVVRGVDMSEECRLLEVQKMAKTDYIPEIHGTIRAKYEWATTLGVSRFQVRNARICVSGNIHPMVAYKAEVDLSDQGVTKMLDAYVRVFPVKGMALTLGQMRIPFSTDNLRSPHLLYFANRSFLAKEIIGLSDVGFSMGYTFNKKFPFSIVAGVFNGAGLYNQKSWYNNMIVSARAVFDPCKYINISLNYETSAPDSMRMNVFDVGVYSEFYGFHIEAEYLFKHYGGVFKPTNAIIGFVNYDLKLPKVFSKISFLARYDAMTENNNGYQSEEGMYVVDDIASQRLTGGITLSLVKPFCADLRVNYEKYFYDNWEVADPSKQDKLVIELMARF